MHHGGKRWLAKAVDAERYGRRFASGLTAAARVTAVGTRAAEPIVTLDGASTVELDGASTVELDGMSVALLSRVDCTPIDVRRPEGMRLIGRTLAEAHLALGATAAQTRIEPYIDRTGLHLGVRPWIRPGIANARASVEALDPATLS